MELPDLVHAVKGVALALRRRPLLAFTLGGLLLFGAKRWLEARAPEPVPLAVVVAAGATEADIERATERALLLAFAERAGFVRADVAVVGRLVDNVRFVSPELSDAAALEQALALEMHRTDAVARERLIALARQTLAEATRTEPSDAELERFLVEQAERFRRPPRFTFEHVLVSRERHGEGFAARVAEVGRELARHRSWRALGDPSLLPAELRRLPPARIEAHFGRAAAEGIASAPSEAWVGPIASVFGAHFFRVRERVPAALPALTEVRERVRHEREVELREQRVRDALSRMRAAYRIRLEERS